MRKGFAALLALLLMAGFSWADELDDTFNKVNKHLYGVESGGGEQNEPAEAPAKRPAPKPVVDEEVPAAVEAPPQAPAPQAGGYIGCFKDDSRRDLKEKDWSDGKMTPGKCIAYCREEGFPYAGVQYGSQCFCGTRYGKYGQIPEKNCKMPCAGDSDLDCGGTWANAVYSVAGVGAAVKPPAAPPVEQFSGSARYLGCFKDDSRRDLKEKNWSDGKMTPDKCIAYCREEGFPYAGVQYGSQCFCGNRYGKYGQIPEKNCKMPCAGDSDLDCGGSWANKVYELGNGAGKGPAKGILR